jgi:hypothetical protein
MTQVLATIRSEFLAAAKRTTRRRRRRHVAITIVAAVASLGAVGAAAVTEVEPIHDFVLPSTDAPDSASRPLTLQISDATRRTWVAEALLSRRGLLCTAVQRQPAKQRAGLGCSDGFVLADNFITEAAASFSVELSDQQAIVYGVIDANARSVSVLDPAGNSHRPNVSERTLTVSTEADQSALTPRGRELAKQIPARLEVRLFTATFPVLAKDEGRAVKVAVTTADGRTRTASAPPLPHP